MPNQVELLNELLFSPIISGVRPYFQVLLGAGITLVTSYTFYMIASKELKDETRELRKLVHIQMRALKAAGAIEYNEDEYGLPIGNRYHIKANIKPPKITPNATFNHESD
jgi:hypothetical protein